MVFRIFVIHARNVMGVCDYVKELGTVGHV